MISPVGMSWILNSIMVLILFLQVSFLLMLRCFFQIYGGKKNPPVRKRSIRNVDLRSRKSNQRPFDLTMNTAEKCIFEINVMTNTHLVGNFSLPDTEMEKQNTVFGALDHQCGEIRSWAVTCGSAGSQCEASFPSLQPEDVASPAPGI